MSYALRMLVGCLLPFMLIFLLPLLGAGEGLTLLVFIVLMFGCHLFTTGSRHGGRVHEGNPKGDGGGS